MAKNIIKLYGYYEEKEGNGIWKPISCFDNKRLKEIYPTKWRDIKIYSDYIEGKRYPLHTRSNSYGFAFNPTSVPRENADDRSTFTQE